MPAAGQPLGLLEVYWNLAPLPAWLGLVVCLLLLRRMLYTGRQQLLLRTAGVTVEGTVLQVGRRRKMDTDRARRRHSMQSEASTYEHVVTYSFRDKRMRTIEGSGVIDRATAESLEVGGPIAVRYVPRMPTLNRVGQDITAIVGAATLVLALPIGAGAAACLYAIGSELLTANGQLELARRGVRTEARIDDRSLGGNFLPPILMVPRDWLELSFATAAGERRRVEMLVPRHLLAGVTEPEQTVELFYDPDDPGRVVLARQVFGLPQR